MLFLSISGMRSVVLEAKLCKIDATSNDKCIKCVFGSIECWDISKKRKLLIGSGVNSYVEWPIIVVLCWDQVPYDLRMANRSQRRQNCRTQKQWDHGKALGCHVCFATGGRVGWFSPWTPTSHFEKGVQRTRHPNAKKHQLFGASQTKRLFEFQKHAVVQNTALAQACRHRESGRAKSNH